MKDLIILAGSAAVVVFMVAVAWLLGFRKRAELNHEMLARLAEAEGVALKDCVLGADGRAGLGLVSGDKVLLARVMGLDVSARFAPAASVTIRAAKGRLIASIADPGYPPLHLRGADAPAWLVERAA